MAKKETHRIRAAADSPEFVAHGNLEAVKEHGYYETDNAKFAEHLEANYGVKTSDKPARPSAKRSKKKSKAAQPAEAPAAAAAPDAAGENTEEVNNNG